MEELHETQGSTLERAKGILSLSSYTKEEIDRILTIPGIADFLVNSISGLVELALSASALGPSIIDIEKSSEKPASIVQVSSIIPPQQSRPKLTKVKKGETSVFLDKDALESMKTEIGAFLQLEIQMILVNWPKYRPWQQLITQAITQWNTSHKKQSLYKYDSLYCGIKNPGGQWRTQYGIKKVEDACRVFGISLPQNMIAVKKSNKKPIPLISDGALGISHPVTLPHIPDNQFPIPDTPIESIITRDLGTREQRSKLGVQSALSKSPTRLHGNSSKPKPKNLTESNPSFEVKDLQDLLNSMNDLLSTVYANINKKDGNIQEKWQGIGDIGTFRWGKESLKGKHTIIISFDEAQKQQRAESKKIWARLATKTFTEHLSRSGWKFSDGRNTSAYGKYYMFDFGNFKIQFHLPFGIEGLKDTTKEEKIGGGTDISRNINTQLGDNELGIIQGLLSIYLDKIYLDTRREYRKSGDSEIGQKKIGISQNKDEFVFDTGKSGYDISRNMKDKKIIIYPSALRYRDTDKVMGIMDFFKKKELLEIFLENYGFRKDDEENWIDDDSKKFIFRQNGSNPILEFQIDEWKIEIHTSSRETQYIGNDNQY